MVSYITKYQEIYLVFLEEITVNSSDHYKIDISTDSQYITIYSDNHFYVLNSSDLNFLSNKITV